VTVSVVAERHPRVEPVLEQPDARLALALDVELALVDESGRPDPIPDQHLEHRTVHPLEIRERSAAGDTRQIVNRQRHRPTGYLRTDQNQSQEGKEAEHHLSHGPK
jgi:hypothetical protein